MVFLSGAVFKKILIYFLSGAVVKNYGFLTLSSCQKHDFFFTWSCCQNMVFLLGAVVKNHGFLIFNSCQNMFSLTWSICQKPSFSYLNIMIS